MIHQRFNVEIEDLMFVQRSVSNRRVHPQVVLPEGEFISKQEKKTNELSAKKQTALYGYGIMPTAHRHYSANCIRH